MPDQPPKILIVEDEPSISRGLKFNFELEGYEAIVAEDGLQAVELLSADDHGFQLVLLDLMLPGLNGYEVCRTIRERDHQLPVLVLSARTLPEDKVQAFDLGSDQYMTKPFALPELLSRVRSLLARRSANSAVPNGDSKAPPQCRFGRVAVDFEKFEVTIGETVHRLTTRELDLLRFFIDHQGIVLSRSKILTDVWDEQADITTRSIDNFVLRLRRIIEENPADPQHILSVRGTGYRFVLDPESEN